MKWNFVGEMNRFLQKKSKKIFKIPHSPLDKKKYRGYNL